MKKKLFATLLVLVVLCMPMFLLTGCGNSDAGKSVLLTTSHTTSVTVTKGQSITEVDWKLTFNYEHQEWDSDEGRYRYVKDDDTYYADTAEAGSRYYLSTDLTNIQDIIAAGVSYRGFDSSEVTAEGKTKTVTFSFGGKRLEIDYVVKAAA